MTWETHPLTPERFEDVADVVDRSRRAEHCWCPSAGGGGLPRLVVRRDLGGR